MPRARAIAKRVVILSAEKDLGLVTIQAARDPGLDSFDAGGADPSLLRSSG
jgi:hypothetical protein